MVCGVEVVTMRGVGMMWPPFMRFRRNGAWLLLPDGGTHVPDVPPLWCAVLHFAGSLGRRAQTRLTVAGLGAAQRVWTYRHE